MKYLLHFIFLLAGSSHSSGPSVRDRQDSALNDPMNYKMDTKEHNDISGGDTAELRKDALKKDLNSVFNP
jgi:hypothetical protein